MTPPDQHRSSRDEFPGGRKPPRQGGAGRGGRGKAGGESAMAKHARYLELAQQARTAGDEVATQHNLQHAEHWYRTAMTDRRSGDDPGMTIKEDALVG